MTDLRTFVPEVLEFVTQVAIWHLKVHFSAKLMTGSAICMTAVAILCA